VFEPVQGKRGAPAGRSRGRGRCVDRKNLQEPDQVENPSDRERGRTTAKLRSCSTRSTRALPAAQSKSSCHATCPSGYGTAVPRGASERHTGRVDALRRAQDGEAGMVGQASVDHRLQGPSSRNPAG
jgi:hypothetical protein